MPFHRRIRAYSGYPALLPLLVCLLLGGRLPGQAHLARIDEALAAVFGEAGREASYSERLQLIHSLPSDLDGGRLERCRRFLESPTELQALPCLEFNGLKNDMVLALLRQKEGLPELAGLLVRMSRDPWTDDVWRDYCVQFLGKCYPAVADMDSRRSMADALWEALETRRASSCAGAAGRQLMSLSRSFREFPPGMCRGRPLRRCAPPNAPTAPAVRCCRSAPSSESLPRFPTPAPLRRRRGRRPASVRRPSPP